MADILEKNKRYLDPNGGGEDGGGSGDPYLDEIHRAVSEKNYKALLQGDIAAYNFHANTRKYLDDTLAQQGFGTQGYGSSAHVGAANQAQTLYAQNLEAYNAGEQEALLAAEDRRKAESTENDNQLVTYLQYSTGTDEDIANYMGNYGYVRNPEDGNWYRKKADGTADLTQPASPYVLSAVQAAKGNAASSSQIRTDYSDTSSPKDIDQGADSAIKNWMSNYKEVNKNGYDSVDALRNAMVGNRDNNTTDYLDRIVHFELNQLSARIDNGNIKSGTLVRLQRSGGHNEAYLVMYYNGKLYILSDDDRENDDGQVAQRYSEYTGPKITLKGW